MFAVLFRSKTDDNTETLYEGSLDNCHIYAQGWMNALIDHTSYFVVTERNDGTHILFHSPLVSEDDIEIWIDKAQTKWSEIGGNVL